MDGPPYLPTLIEEERVKCGKERVESTLELIVALPDSPPPVRGLVTREALKYSQVEEVLGEVRVGLKRKFEAGQLVKAGRVESLVMNVSAARVQ